MSVSEKIKERIAYLRERVANLTDEGYDSYDEGKADGFDEEISFLIELLDQVERQVLKEKGYNV